MWRFWDAIDTAENIARAGKTIRNVRGAGALLLIVPLVLIMLCTGWFAWHFDIDATAEWTQKGVPKLFASMETKTIAYVSWGVAAITLLPTLVELFMAKFAISGYRFAAILVFSMALFDMVTDWPRVVEFFSAYKSDFDKLGWFGDVVRYVLQLFWLFLASFGFESVTIVLAVMILLLLIQMKSPRYSRQEILRE